MKKALALTVILALAGATAWQLRQQIPGLADGSMPSGAPPKAAPGERAVTVNVAAAIRKDVPITLDGLGTVQAYRTVTVHSRIDGQLMSIDFKEGQDVKAGDALAHVDERSTKAQLEQAQATRDKDAAQLEMAKFDLERYVKLGNRVTGQSVDNQRSLVKQLEAQMRADAAAADNAATQLSYTVITAPIDGRTGIRLVDEGNIVHAADTTGLVVLTQLQPIAVIFTLPQQVLPRIDQVRLRAGELPVTALAADGKTEVDKGTLSLIDNQIDTTTGTIRLKAIMPNDHYQLWPGGFANIRLRIDMAAGALVVPMSAVQRGPQGAYVFVVKPDHTAEMRPVAIGGTGPEETWITQGLEEGETVVTDGAGRVQNGQKVAVPGAAGSPT